MLVFIFIVTYDAKPLGIFLAFTVSPLLSIVDHLRPSNEHNGFLIELCLPFFLVCSFIGQYLYSVKLSEWGNKWLHQTVFVEIIAPILEERWYDYLGEFGWFQWGMPFLNSVVIKFRSEHSFVWICRSTAYQMSKNMGVKTSQSCLWNSEWKYATNKIWKCEPDIICIFFVCKIYLN